MITVAMISWNHEDFVEYAIRSVVEQDCVEYEIVFVDNASTDRTVTIARNSLERANCPVTVVTNDCNLGLGRALNQALELSTGAFFAPMSCDDAMVPGRLRLQLEEISRQPPEVVGVAGLAPMIDETGARFGDSNAPDPVVDLSYNGSLDHFRISLLKGPQPSAPTVMLRTSDLRAIGGYDPKAIAEDLDLWLRMAFLHNRRVLGIPFPLSLYRRHQLNVTQRNPVGVFDSVLYSLSKLEDATLSETEFQHLNSRRISIKGQRDWYMTLSSCVNAERFRRGALERATDRNLTFRMRLFCCALLVLPGRLSRNLVRKRYPGLENRY